MFEPRFPSVQDDPFSQMDALPHHNTGEDKVTVKFIL